MNQSPNKWHLSKIQQTKMLVTSQRFGDLFFWGGWSDSILQFRQNIIKVGSNLGYLLAAVI